MLNSNKTQAIILDSARYINSIDIDSLPNIKVCKANIPFSSNVKYLKIHISSNLSWDKQVTNTVSKIYTKLY